jgi:hypothetical protein
MYSDVKFYGTTKSPGANPTIASYNASVEKIYNPTGSLVCFENKKYILLLKKMLLPTTMLYRTQVQLC